MMFTLIQIENLTYDFAHKCCFADFSTIVSAGMRIAIMGENGAGKSSLLKILHGDILPTGGQIKMPNELRVGYVEQLIDGEGLSGAERFQKALSQAIAKQPDVLLLDEPSNHLDPTNRQKLKALLERFYGTLIMATHDEAFLREYADEIWHIEHGRVIRYSGTYDAYRRERLAQHEKLSQQLKSLQAEKIALQSKLEKEQQRAKKRKASGIKKIKNNHWPTVKSPTKLARAVGTTHHRQKTIEETREQIIGELHDNRMPEVLTPKFHLLPEEKQGSICIREGRLAYGDKCVLSQLTLDVAAGEHIAILGNNGSGKTTLLKALRQEHIVSTSGDWLLPVPSQIGYLDQHYRMITNETVYDHIKQCQPDWTMPTIRHHLNDFLFRKDHEVEKLGLQLSGGERARLALAIIAAKPPRLLILDEITNNLDLVAKEYVAQVLREYPGTLVMVSHDEAFLSTLNLDSEYQIEGNTLKEKRRT